MKLTPEQSVEAAKLRSVGMTWKAIGEHFCCDPETVKRAVDFGFAVRRRSQINQARAVRSGVARRKRKVMVGPTGPREIPFEVLAERDRVAAIWPTANQAVLGDPMPGRSALDMRV